MDFDLEYILIDQLSAHTCIGCTAQERAFPQRLLFSLKVGVPARAPVARTFTNDIHQSAENLEARLYPTGISLQQTVCFARTSELIETLCRIHSWVLVEDLAEAISDAIFTEFPPASCLEIEIKKFAVPHTNWTGIRVAKRRDY